MMPLLRNRDAERTVRRGSMKLALVVPAVGLALAFGSPSAGATNQARAAGRCSNESVRVFGQPTTLRFVLYGVSCSQAHSLIRTYFHDATIRSCASRGNICAFFFPGGWVCSFPLYSGEGGGYFAACRRSQSDRFKVFRVPRATRDGRRTPQTHK
jgi:hypothetical protein